MNESVDKAKLRVAGVALPILLLGASFVLTRTARDALYIQERGLFDLPQAYVGIALLSPPIALLTLALMRRLGPRRLRVAAPFAAGLLLLFYQQMARPGGGPLMTLFFMLVPLVFSILLALAWLLAADLLERAPRKLLARAYSLVGAAAVAGGVGGGLIARLMAGRAEPASLLTVAAAFLWIASMITALVQRSCPQCTPGKVAGRSRRPSLEDLRAVLRGRYTTTLLGVAMLGSLAGILIEFQFYLAAATSGGGGAENVRLFANLYLILNGAALLLLLGIVPGVQRRIGVYKSLLALPGVLIGGAGLLFGSATIVNRLLVRVAEGGLKSSIHRANWEQTYLPLDRNRRAVTKIMVDGAAVRIAEGLGAAILFVWLHFFVADSPLAEQNTQWLLWFLLAAVLLWFTLTRALDSLGGAQVRAACEREGERLDIPLPDS
jgi:ATP/ADP translocase